MKKTKRIMLAAVCLLLLFVAAGFSAKGKKITVADIAEANSYETLFKTYDSMRTVAVYLDDLETFPEGETRETIHIRDGDGYASISLNGDGEWCTVVKDHVYWETPDGAYEVTVFLDDGIFKDWYLPSLTWPSFIPGESEEVISVSAARKGVRTVVTHVPSAELAAIFPDDFATEGTEETHYELDAKTGRILRYSSYYLALDGEKTLVSEHTIRYGEDDDFTMPEYVAKCRDMSETRVVNYVKDGETFSFTLPKNAKSYALTREEYYLFADADFTLPYKPPAEGYPDEETIYMKPFVPFAAKGKDITLADLANANHINAFFETYDSLRLERADYGVDGVIEETSSVVYVKGDEGHTAYGDTSDEMMSAIDSQNVFWYMDGVHEVTAFFDDGIYEEVYLTKLSWPIYAPTEGEEIISVSDVTEGVRTVVTHLPAAIITQLDPSIDETDGMMEIHYELDAETGRIQRAHMYHLANGGESRLTVEATLVCGEDDDFTPPEYVAWCKDMSVTRTVRYIRHAGTPEEETFTFVIPKKAGLYPSPRENYAYFSDAACTVPYEAPAADEDGYPDAETIYMKLAEAES